MRCTIAVVILLLPTHALAGGVSWSFLVESLESRSSEEAVVVLMPSGERPYFAQPCASIRIEVRYKREPFWRRTWSKDLVTRAAHEAALGTIRSAFESQELIRFGVMGTGLAPSPSAECAFQSNGLDTLEESDGEQAVYSFHDPV